PEGDPDVSLLKESGYWLEQPLTKGQRLKQLAKLFNIASLVRYTVIRSQYASLLSFKHAFRRRDAKASHVLIYNLSVVLHLVGLFALTIALVWRNDALLLKWVPWAFGMVFFSFYLFLPE